MRPLYATSSPQEQGIPLLHILPAIEGIPNAAWLEALVHNVHIKLGQIPGIQVLEAVHITHLSHTSLRSPKLPLLIVPWGNRQVSLQPLYHLLHLESSPHEWETVPLPEIAPTSIIPLSQLGGWCCASQANWRRLLSICPGWDAQISTNRQIFVLRRLDSSPLSSEMAHVPRVFESPHMDAQYDRQLYSTYLAHVLIATIKHIALLLRTRNKVDGS